jgi:hypothetical protein
MASSKQNDILNHQFLKKIVETEDVFESSGEEANISQNQRKAQSFV